MIHHTPRERNDATPRHEVGEIVWADYGNFIESPNCLPKARPLILLRVSDCQHTAAGVTTKASHQTTGEPRRKFPIPLGLGAESYLWGNRPAHVSRLNVRSHAGWVDPQTVLFLREAMPDTIDAETFAALWRAAVQHKGEQ